jgi:hypothetical protein
MNEDNLSPPVAMDAVWVELTDVLGAVFADVDKLVRAIVAFLSTPAAPLVSEHAQLGFPNHNQIHVLGNLLQLPAMQHEHHCLALSSLLANDGSQHLFLSRMHVLAHTQPQSSSVRRVLACHRSAL